MADGGGEADQFVLKLGVSVGVKPNVRKGFRNHGADGSPNICGDEAQLVFTTSKGIQLKNMSRSEYKELALPGPGPLAVMVSNRTLYWAQQGRGSIYRKKRGRSNTTAVYKEKTQSKVSTMSGKATHKEDDASPNVMSVVEKM